VHKNAALFGDTEDSSYNENIVVVMAGIFADEDSSFLLEPGAPHLRQLQRRTSSLIDVGRLMCSIRIHSPAPHISIE
jgi:hypothetical protein